MAFLETDKGRRDVFEAVPEKYHNFLTAYLAFSMQLNTLNGVQAEAVRLRLERVVMELQQAQDMLTNDAKVLVSTPEEMVKTGESLCFLLYPSMDPEPVDPKNWTFARQYASAVTLRPGESKPVKPVMGITGVGSMREFGVFGKTSWFSKDGLSAIAKREAEAGAAWLTDPAILQKIKGAVIRELPRGVRKPILAAGL
jgi:hypothetical protein